MPPDDPRPDQGKQEPAFARDERVDRMEFLLSLRRRGISDAAVLRAMDAVPREAFVLQSIPAAKFLQPVLPEERIELRIQFTAMEAAKLRASFQGLRADSVVFEGSFVVSAPGSAR